MKKKTLEEIEIELQKRNKNLLVLDERTIKINSKSRREILVKNSLTGSEFWTQVHRLKSYDFNIVRYNTETIREYIKNITDDEYELIGECTKFDSKINILHKKCNQIREYRASHFINDETRCLFCLHERLRKTNEQFDLELRKKSEGAIIRKGNYISYHNEILLHCNKCNKDFITKPVDIDKQFKMFERIHCPNCYDKYIGEIFIREILSDLNIPFKCQYSDKRCKDKRALRFDFAIFNNDGLLKALIEYDGSQHKDPNSKYARGRFEEIIYHDKLKDEFCKNNNIPLLRTSKYSKKAIELEIKQFLQLE